MLITDIAGNNLIVKRQKSGSTLAAHTGSTIYAPRQVTITRGDLGTTAGSLVLNSATASGGSVTQTVGSMLSAASYTVTWPVAQATSAGSR